MRNREEDGDFHSSLLTPNSSFLIPHSIDKPIFEKLSIPTIDVSPENAQKIIQGKPLAQILGSSLPPPSGKDTAVAVFSDNAFIAIIEQQNNEGFPWSYGYVYARD
jgi:hypothetical protein